MKDVVPNLYEHWVSQDILTYMIIGAGSKSRGDYIRIINRPKRYIRRADLAEPVIDLDKLAASYSDKPWIAERVQQLEEDIANLSGMEPFAAVNYIRHSIGYESFLREYAEFRRLRSDELIEILDELQEASRPYRSLEEWLAHIKKYTEELNERKKTDSVQDGVWISTIHGSKGLEYKVVFILDANEGVIPHRRTNQPDEMEEERRLFYVAMTRAKTYLHIYSCKKHFGKDAQVSRFVYESLGNRLASLNDYVEDGAEGQHQDNAGTAWARLSEKTTGLYQKTTGLSQRTTGLYQNATRLSQKTTEPSQKKNTAQPYYKQDPSQRGRDILRYGWHI
jgi:DNA helicase-2/ATP-dependent DNA helicase PcrA